MSGQASISSFFSPPAKPKKARSHSPIDLTLSDDEPRQKRRRMNDSLPVLPSPAEKWNYTPGSPSNPLPSQAVSSAAAIRKATLKKMLLEDNNPLLRRKQSREFSESSRDDRSEYDSDDTTVSKVKAKKSTTRSTKSDAPVGPSGKAYTPLEKQVLEVPEADYIAPTHRLIRLLSSRKPTLEPFLWLKSDTNTSSTKRMPKSALLSTFLS